MYDIRWIRDNKAQFDQGLLNRNASPLGDHVLAIDDRRRAAIMRAQEAQEKRNALSKEIGQAMAAKDQARAESLKAEVATLKEVLASAEVEEKAVVAELEEALQAIPNTPLDEVPVGADEHGNVLLHSFGTPRTFDFEPKQHFEIGEALGILDVERGAKMSGSMFVLYRRKGAALVRALVQYALDRNADSYEEIRPPTLVRTDTMIATGHLPKFADDAYYLERDDLWAIPTAEVPLTSLARDEILDESVLPMRLMAHTSCFRREAGSAGRDTRGLLRVHEFDKVEILAYTT
ncbi:MAG: serine--tRNA ligase, partial [Hyphomicrobiales bacterium]|nr:serine--tRNA ligase [Hyphomicrobiales bacterium]